MYKVLIIDDEPIIRQGLKKIIDWGKYNCEVCAEAPDGETGLEYIKQFLPDIILTDIKMKQMSGLEMISAIDHTVPHAKIIILTAYGEFDYAQQAIALKVFRFLLKPCTPEEIQNVIKDSTTELSINKSSFVTPFTIEEKQFLENKLLSDIANNSIRSISQIEDNLKKYGTKIKYFYMVLIKIDFLAMENVNSVTPYMITDFFSNHDYIINFLDSNLANELYFIIRCRNGENIDLNALCSLMEDILLTMHERTNAIYKAYTSSIGFGYKDITIKKAECISISKTELYTYNNSIICYEDSKELTDTVLLKRDKLIEKIREGEIDHINTCIYDFSETFLSIGDIRILKNLCYDTIDRIYKISELAFNSTNYNYDSVLYLMAKSNNPKEIVDLISTIALNLTKKINAQNTNTRKLTLDLAIEYIYQHYMEDITRTSLANHTYVSPSYISYIFTENMNKTFSEFLTEVRIEKAKELLLDPSLKINEVSNMVGIADPQYFSKTFKKLVGLTPKEYRNKYL